MIYFLKLAAPAAIATALLLSAASLGHAQSPPSEPRKVDKDERNRVSRQQRIGWWSDDGDEAPSDTVKAARTEKLAAVRAMWLQRMQLVRKSLAAAQMPPQTRAKLLSRFDRLAQVLQRRFSRIDISDLNSLEGELEGLGEEIKAELEGLEDEFETEMETMGLADKLSVLGELDGDIFGEDGRQGHGRRPGRVSPPSPPSPPSAPSPWSSAPPSPPSPPSPPVPSWSLTPDGDRVDLAALDGIALRPEQRTTLRAAKQAADANIRVAQRNVDRLSKQLNDLLRDVNADPAKINALVDSISSAEAAMRKARINAWLKARAVLDARQRGMLESAP